MRNLLQDVRYGLRLSVKSPGITIVAVLTLAFGIGATTALFSVVYGVLISPYPYDKPQEIWTPGIVSVNANQRMRPYRLSEYLEMAKLRVFSDVMATEPGVVLLSGEFAPETLAGRRLSANAFQFLGVRPVVGRTILPCDVSPSGVAAPVVVLSFKLWQRLFGGDTNVVGRTLRLDDQAYTIIGVMPSRFGWWTDDGVWLPLGLDSPNRSVFPIARLKPAVSSSVAAQQLHALQVELAKANPSGFPGADFDTTLTNYLDITAASGAMQRSLRLLFGAVGFLLVIACVNVANLQLARVSSRTREMAIRLALGARGTRLMRQLLVESVLVSLLGGLLGLLFAFCVTHVMVMMMPSDYVPNESRIEVNSHVLWFCAMVSVLTGIFFGLVPAFRSSRPNVVEALKEVRASSSAAGGRTRELLVVVEVTLSMVLLVSAGLTIRSFVALQKVDLGFQPEHVMAVNLTLPPKHYATWDQRNRFARELLERVKNVPGVQAATIGNGGLPFGGLQSTFGIDGQTDSEARTIRLHAISTEYLNTLGIALRQGRMLTEQEINRSDQVALINEAAAKLWPSGQSPVGRRIRLDILRQPAGSSVLTPANASPDVTIIGVIGNTRNDGLENDAKPAVLIPYTLLAPPSRTLAVRAYGEPKALMSALRTQVREIDRGQPLNAPFTFEEILGLQIAQPRFIMALFGLFALLGLGMVMAGVYSVLSYMVSMRTHEIGLRMALGARQVDVLRLILRAAGRLVSAGLATGALASLGAARVLRSQLELFQVTTADPVSFLSVAALLSLVAVVACWVPARRATNVDPMTIIRYE